MYQTLERILAEARELGPQTGSPVPESREPEGAVT
jgi:hypothetical protein